MARSFRRAATWRPKRAGDQVIDIAQLISPLRFDVLVRAQFFDFLQRRPDGEPDDALVRAAQGEPYAVWFRDVAMARFRPWVLKDPEVMAQSFAERVLSARALLRSFQTRGYDPSSPVTLRLTAPGTTSDTGVPIRRTVHVGDGGHRLAMLLQAGLPLQPHMYRLDPRPMPLIDNTAVLLERLDVSDEDYLAFVARGYTPEPVPDLPTLRTVVARHGPAAVTELDRVLSTHGRNVTEAGR